MKKIVFFAMLAFCVAAGCFAQSNGNDKDKSKFTYLLCTCKKETHRDEVRFTFAGKDVLAPYCRLAALSKKDDIPDEMKNHSQFAFARSTLKFLKRCSEYIDGVRIFKSKINGAEYDSCALRTKDANGKVFFFEFIAFNETSTGVAITDRKKTVSFDMCSDFLSCVPWVFQKRPQDISKSLESLTSPYYVVVDPGWQYNGNAPTMERSQFDKIFFE